MVVTPGRKRPKAERMGCAPWAVIHQTSAAPCRNCLDGSAIRAESANNAVRECRVATFFVGPSGGCRHLLSALSLPLCRQIQRKTGPASRIPPEGGRTCSTKARATFVFRSLQFSPPRYPLRRYLVRRLRLQPL